MFDEPIRTPTKVEWANFSNIIFCFPAVRRSNKIWFACLARDRLVNHVLNPDDNVV